MSYKAKEKVSFFWNFVLEFRLILQDVLFVYRHFFHWTLSRIIVSVWSIILGILLSLPFFLFAVLMAWIDPISWLEYFQENPDATNIVFDHLALHPYWFVSILFLLLTSVIVFLLASSYSLLLLARISYKYTQGKLLDYKKNLYTSWKHIHTFISVFSLNFVYLLAPVMLWCGGVFFVYFFYHADRISFSALSYTLLGLTLILIWAWAYVSYRILFGYIILASEKDPKQVHKARKYLQYSLQITNGKNIIKFFFLLALYALITFPFQYIDTTLSYKLSSLKDTLNFRQEKVDNIDAEDMAYYEYLNEEYESYSDQEIIDSMRIYSWGNFLYFVLYTLVFGWLFILLLTSFYVRVLEKDTIIYA